MLNVNRLLKASTVLLRHLIGYCFFSQRGITLVKAAESVSLLWPVSLLLVKRRISSDGPPRLAVKVVRFQHGGPHWQSTTFFCQKHRSLPGLNTWLGSQLSAFPHPSLTFYLYLRRHSPGAGWAGITNRVEHVSEAFQARRSCASSLHTFTQSFPIVSLFIFFYYRLTWSLESCSFTGVPSSSSFYSVPECQNVATAAATVASETNLDR